MSFYKNKTIVLACIFIAGCGVSSKPGESDIKKQLEKDLGGCPHIKLSNIKKDNGMEGETKNKYIIEESYTVTYTPSKVQLAIIEEIKKTKEIATATKESIQAIKEKIKDLSAQRDQELGRINRLIIDSRAAGNFNTRILEDEGSQIRSAFIENERELEKEMHALAKDKGFPSYHSVLSPNSFIEAKYLPGLRSDFIDACPRQSRTRNGESITLRLLSHGNTTFDGTFLSPEEKTIGLKHKRLYTKTENGWIAAD